jgi:hypothetical protein
MLLNACSLAWTDMFLVSIRVPLGKVESGSSVSNQVMQREKVNQHSFIHHSRHGVHATVRVAA